MASFLRQLPLQRLATLQISTKHVLKSSLSSRLVKQSSDSRCTAAIQPLVTHTRHLHSTPISCVDNVNSDDIASSSSSSSLNIPPSSKIYQYDENIKDMTNEELNDPTTIPGFSTLIHSPPRDRFTTPRNALVGIVVSDKMQKTVNVNVDRYRIVPKYRKRLKYSRKFMCHDEEEVCKEGDLVMIVPCQRLSRRKHFRVHEIIKRKGSLLD